ncbi:MAG TPA: hypothetical protein PK850_03810 [Ignavibacteria bacterium]|nr:hypothetical protein [Ignavibacteria bacterium]HRF65060.1 hypothetical protein [Ignavibacteria bacterium]
MANKIYLVIIITFLIFSCNIKNGYEDSKTFLNSNKEKLTIICSEFRKYSDIQMVSLTELKDSSYHNIQINTRHIDEVNFINQIRDFLKATGIKRIEKGYNSKLILFYLSNMDGIAFKISSDSYLDFDLAFAKHMLIDSNWYYFLDKTI